jgi:hypothetical protein
MMILVRSLMRTSTTNSPIFIQYNTNTVRTYCRLMIEARRTHTRIWCPDTNKQTMIIIITNPTNSYSCLLRRDDPSTSPSPSTARTTGTTPAPMPSSFLPPVLISNTCYLQYFTRTLLKQLKTRSNRTFTFSPPPPAASQNPQ